MNRILLADNVGKENIDGILQKYSFWVVLAFT